MKRWCSVMSYDYLDLDVFLNTRTFYEAAGYRVTKNWLHPQCDLLVILRGNPKETLLSYTRRVHIYDYVKELTVDWKEQLPNASSIHLISIKPPDRADALHHIHGYVPVISQIWRRPFSGKRTMIVHIANFKFHMKDDLYQKELVSLLQNSKVRVYGGKWENVNVLTRKMSYREANATLARSLVCIGLMHPYQRGESLSGRMWQGPLNGCAVISEYGTNILGCPGVMEVANFQWDTIIECLRTIGTPEQLSRQATEFWETRTRRLAADLGETLPALWPTAGLLRCRAGLLLGHSLFVIGEIRSRLVGPRRFWVGLRRRVQAVTGR
jgi:hypothetical protein